jgi:hypothetical protein
LSAVAGFGGQAVEEGADGLQGSSGRDSDFVSNPMEDVNDYRPPIEFFDGYVGFGRELHIMRDNGGGVVESDRAAGFG